MKLCAVFFIIFANLGQWRHMLVSCKIITAELCGAQNLIKLESTGEASSVTIHLNPKDYKRTCRLNITAPSSHVVSLQWHEEHRELLDNHSTGNSPCPLNIFLPEYKQTAVWKGDPCAKHGLSEVDLLTPQFTLVWTPPRFGSHARGRKLVITAVGQGNVCKAEGQQPCMRIGFDAVLCISSQLVCDGNPNCPQGSDEHENLCKSKQIGHTSWQQFAEDVIKQLPPEVIGNKWIDNKRKDVDVTTENWHIPQIPRKELKKYEISVTTDQPEPHHHHDSEDSVSAALAHYGPWGYLMLGMLICGTVLMFCGLWECCFRKPKPQADLLQSQQQPTTVLIINSAQDDVMGRQPPNYDDLDQPPSYMTLFPNFKLETVEEDNIESGEQVNSESDENCDSSVPNTSSDSGEDEDLSGEDEVATILCGDSVDRGMEVPRERRSPIVCIVTNV